MWYTLIFTDSYKKRAKRFARQHPELKERYRKILLLSAQNPYYTSLRLHTLKASWWLCIRYRSILAIE